MTIDQKKRQGVWYRRFALAPHGLVSVENVENAGDSQHDVSLSIHEKRQRGFLVVALKAREERRRKRKNTGQHLAGVKPHDLFILRRMLYY